jgi:EAL domain-containing protein (putative c-di-GMP-specific phosphodiesterase class I)
MLEHVYVDLEQGGKLTRGMLRQNLPFHINLTLEGIVSQEFARLAETARRTGARFGVEVSLMEAASDPAMMAYARRLLDMAEFPLIIDCLDHVALTFTHPAVLQPALLKLTWSPRLCDGAPRVQAAIEAAIERIGPDRLVLQHVESEAALVWGQAHGIKRFQGFFLDSIQAAARIGVCHSARACTLRQCTTRAASFSPAMRVGCGNPGLLDLGPPVIAANPAGTAGAAPSTGRQHALHPST